MNDAAVDVLGQGEAFARVLAAARRLQLHHGLVLTGGPGTGKSTAALTIARALLCEAADRRAPCGACAICARVASRNHPDVHVLTVPKDKQDIPVDHVRELQATLQRHAVEGRARVVLIDPAERLTDQAQNALLKTLEEPGADTFLLAATSRPEGLLATVRSRTQRLRLRPLAPAQIESALAGRGAGDAESRRLAAAGAAGSLGLALELIEADVKAMHQQLVEFLQRPTDISAVGRAHDLLEAAPDRDSAQRRVRLVLAYARARLRETLLGSLAPATPPTSFPHVLPTWAAVFHTLFDAEEDLDLRIAPEQVLANALFRLQEELPRLGAAELCPQ